MLKLLLTQDGDPMIMLALDRNNTRELHKGHPIMFDAREFGVPATIVILAGETMQDIGDELAEHGIDVTGAIKDLGPPPGDPS